MIRCPRGQPKEEMDQSRWAFDLRRPSGGYQDHRWGRGRRLRSLSATVVFQLASRRCGRPVSTLARRHDVAAVEDAGGAEGGRPRTREHVRDPAAHAEPEDGELRRARVGELPEVAERGVDVGEDFPIT
jgi:hypothetical protein